MTAHTPVVESLSSLMQQDVETLRSIYQTPVLVGSASLILFENLVQDSLGNDVDFEAIAQLEILTEETKAESLRLLCAAGFIEQVDYKWTVTTRGMTAYYNLLVSDTAAASENDWKAGMSPSERMRNFYVYGGYEGFVGKAFMSALAAERDGQSASEIDAEMITAAGPSVLNRALKEMRADGFISYDGDTWLLTELGVAVYREVCA